MEQKIEESNRNWQRQQAAVQKNAIMQRANYLKADLSPHLTQILSENIYFCQNTKSYIETYDLNKVNQTWTLSLIVKTDSEMKLDSPRAIISLNETKNTYWHRLDLEMKAELQQLSMMADAPNANQVNIQISHTQILRKYELLNHQLQFQHIECFQENGLNFARIWLLFK